MKLRVGPSLVALTFAVAAGGVHAEQRHLGPHVHGQATLQLSVEGPVMDVGLSIPGHDAVGFEHPPSTPDQTLTLAHAKQVLLTGTWLVPAAAAGCVAPPATVVADGFDANAKPGGHGDFDVTARFTCASPARLGSLEVGLFTAFPTLQRVVVDIVTASGATEQVLDRPMTHVTLSP
ncbi:hypothetical protein ACVWWJ_003217 [Luteibacter sp. HA06]